MTNEEFLLQTIKRTAIGIEEYIDLLNRMPEDYQIHGFDDGKLCGLVFALGGIKTSLSMYERYVKGEISAVEDI